MTGSAYTCWLARVLACAFIVACAEASAIGAASDPGAARPADAEVADVPSGGPSTVAAAAGEAAGDSLIAGAGDSAATPLLQSAPASFRRITSVGLVGGSLVLSTVWAFDEWWKNNATPFHLLHEGWFGDYALGIDKVGHFYTSYLYFRLIQGLLLWGEFPEETAFWWGAGLTALFALGVEVGDGLTPYGFSFEDLTSNFLGLGYAMLQARNPLLQNFTFKWSYIPDRGTPAAAHFTRYYDFHTYWLSVNVRNLLPGTMQEYWPEFLQLAVGYSTAGKQTRREWVIGLDFNLEVFTTSNTDMRLLGRAVNMFHIPAPGIEFGDGRSPKYKLFYLR